MVTIDGTTGIDKVVDGSIATVDLADGAVTQAKLGTNVSTTGPAFRAYRSSTAQTVTSSVQTKAQLNVENYDTANAFDSTTNYRFQPTVAGYYQLNGSISAYGSSGSITRTLASIYVNGALYSQGSDAVGGYGKSVVSDLVYLNGSTDYAELYGYVTASTTAVIDANMANTFFSGFLARAA